MVQLSFKNTAVNEVPEKQSSLEALNLTESILKEALFRGLSARRTMTENNPLTSKGQYFYSEAVRALRELLATNGYEKISVRNVELCINKEIGVAIYLCGGCSQTGLANGYPQSIYSKGDFLLDLFGLHRHESPNLDLFHELLPTINNQNNLKCDIWFLLHHIDKNDNSIRAELCKAKSHDNRGFVTGFDLDNRIIIDMTTQLVIPKEPDFSPEVDFDIDEL